MKLRYIEKEEIGRLLSATKDLVEKAKVLAAVARFNTLYAVKRAGSGHLGSSFSAMDIVATLYSCVMKYSNTNARKYERDIYFSSKGHDAPGLYSILTALDLLDFEKIHQLRRLNGLPGHPDIATPFIFTNTGSLGMGISKAKGFVQANRLSKTASRVYVLLGDGELQEGQFWESLHSAVNSGMDELIAIIDHNKIQSDKYVRDVSDLGDLQSKIKAFGWQVERCDGHDINQIMACMEKFQERNGMPKLLIADTLKGRGVSFMEPSTMTEKYYKYHSGAPSDLDYERASLELEEKINSFLKDHEAGKCQFKAIEVEGSASAKSNTRLVAKYSQIVLEQARKNEKVLCLDADLVLDTGLIPLSEERPSQFIECGIAEQDMVSQAGALALRGHIPICHSFSCFMIPRANEQIYNNCTEKSKIIYMGFLSGLLPAGPGHSHQSVRDLALMRCNPGMTILAPSTENELDQCMAYALTKNNLSSFIRIESLPTEIPMEGTLSNSPLIEGQGNFMSKGRNVALVSYGPTLTAESLRAAALLKEVGIDCSVVTMPWLNRFDKEWWSAFLQQHPSIFILDNHLYEGGLGQFLAQEVLRHNLAIDTSRFFFMALDSIPECGQPQEILEHHGLNAAAIVQKIRGHVNHA